MVFHAPGEGRYPFQPYLNIESASSLYVSAESSPRGFLYEPEYEEEVVMLFGLIIPRLNDSYLIESCSGAFPDCFALRNGQRIGIEFELLSGNFFAQRHERDPRLKDCSMLVCWKNN